MSPPAGKPHEHTGRAGGADPRVQKGMKESGELCFQKMHSSLAHTGHRLFFRVGYQVQCHLPQFVNPPAIQEGAAAFLDQVTTDQGPAVLVDRTNL